jgi:hypothetical protein
MPALAIRKPEDAMLGAVAPLGFAVAAPGPALVIDLDRRGPRYFGSGSLAELVAEGPRRSDLSPSRSGVAVLRNGGVSVSTALPVVNHLVAGWPFVVLRLEADDDMPWTSVSVVPLLPLAPPAPDEGAVVYQDAGWGLSPPGPGPVLPVPRRSTWAALAAGRKPVIDRWLRSLRQVWAWA